MFLFLKKATSTSSGRPPENATIQKSTDGTGYVIIKEKPGDKINTDKIKNLYDFVEQNLDANRYVIDISGVDCYETATLTVHPAAIDSYQAANYWKLFTNIVETTTVDPPTGDTNGDGVVNITDVTALIDMLLNGGN